jgi:hypothetical protein
MDEEFKSLLKRIEKVEKDIAAIKRLRIVSTNLQAQEHEDALNEKMMRPQADKAIHGPESDK